MTSIRLFSVLSIIASDLAMMFLAFRAAHWLRLRTEGRPSLNVSPPDDYTQLTYIFAATVVIAFALNQLYIPRRGFSRVDLLYGVMLGTTTGFFIALAVTALLYRSLELPRLMIVYWWICAIVLTWCGRVILDFVIRFLRSHDLDIARVIIVGSGEPARIISSKIQHAPELGYRVVGFLGLPGEEQESVLPIIGRIEDMVRIIRDQRASELIVAEPALSHQQVLEIVTNCARERINIKVFPDILQIMSTEVTTSDLSGLPMLQVRDIGLRGWNLALKRTMDIVVSGVILVAMSPIMLVLALLVKLTSGHGPVFYAQERVGLDGKPFQLIKFRSMRQDAEDGTGPVMATPDDTRRTLVGTFIRRWSLDELPQLINVLVGEMSLVGPRPERPVFVEQFSRIIPRYAERHNEKAGMTGWAQVNGLRGQTSIEERTKYDVFYVENWSLAFDIKILLKTIRAVIIDRNAY
ncbi:MAG: undecaprenyl-phosphate glucose phosphotransferase [Chloroflexota bacterium]